MENQLMKKEERKGMPLQSLNNFEQMQRICNLFANSTIVPSTFQSVKMGRDVAIANCFIALNMAERLNADPFMIMQNIYIVQGKPSFSSSFLIATVNSCGRFDPLKFSKIETKGQLTHEGKTVDNLTCFCYTTEKGSEEVLQGTEISIEMAIKEGWYSKNGSKWQTIPEQMLRYRAASFWVRVYCPEIAMGLQTMEEVRDVETVEYEELPETNRPRVDYVTKDEVRKEIRFAANKEALQLIVKQFGDIVMSQPDLKAEFENKAKELKLNAENEDTKK